MYVELGTNQNSHPCPPSATATSKQEKCAQYWPTAEETETAFRDTGFLVAVLSEDVKSYYTTRVLELQNLSVGLNMMKTVGSRPVESSGRFSCCGLRHTD